MANCVCIKYNGKLLAPTPMVSLSRSFQEVGGRHVGSTITVQLDGKIVAGTRPNDVNEFLQNYPCGDNYTVDTVIGIAATGIDGLLKEEQAMRDLFVANTGQLTSDATRSQSLGVSPASSYVGDDQTNKIEITVNGAVILEGYGRLNSYNSNSDNYYINTINYTAELAIEEPKSLFNNNDTRYLISSYTDNITIEPLDESSAFYGSDSVASTYFGLGNVKYDTLGTDYNSTFANTTRYRVSRSISAVGKHSNNHLTSSASDPSRSLGIGAGSAFSNARYYVLDRLKHYPTTMFMSSDYVITNRVKVIEGSDSDGSFSINETSVAIDKNYHPPWIDDWTAEISIDNTFLQTVRINGTVKGLETYGTDIQEENASVMDGSQPSSWANTQGGASPGGIDTIHSYADGFFPDIINPLTNSSAPANYDQAGEAKIGKYQNALQGMLWLKNTANPYASPIYRRAELFFKNGTFSNPANPYRWLNNQNLLTERQSSPSTVNLPPMNPIPVSMTESHRKHAGEVDYSFEFNNRPLNLVAGSVSETLSISDTFPTQQIAEIFVLGRKLGPVLQDLGTVTSATRDVNFEVVLPRPRILAQRFIFPTATFTAITSVVDQLNPKYLFGTSNNNQTNIKSYVKADNQTYDPLEGRIRVQKTWVWQRAK